MEPGYSVSISAPAARRCCPQMSFLRELWSPVLPATISSHSRQSRRSLFAKPEQQSSAIVASIWRRQRFPPPSWDSISETTVRRDKVLPVAMEDDHLIVAVSDPQAFESVDHLRFELDRPITLVMAPEDALLAAMDRYFPHLPARALATSVSEPAEGGIEFVEVAAVDQAVPAQTLFDPESAPVSDRVQELLSEAFRMGALRVLIMPAKDRVTIAYRIHDAVCQREDLPPQMLYSVLVRLMTRVNLHGMLKVSLGGQERRLHVTFKPTEHGVSALIEIPQDVSPSARCKTQAARFGYRLVNLEATEIPAPILETVPESSCQAIHSLAGGDRRRQPIGRVPDPGKPEVLDSLRFILNRRISAAIAAEDEILLAIDRYYGVPDPEVAALLLRELSQPPESAGPGSQPSEHQARQSQAVPGSLAQSVLDHLRTLCGEGMFRLFENVRTSPQLQEGAGQRELGGCLSAGASLCQGFPRRAA